MLDADDLLALIGVTVYQMVTLSEGRVFWTFAKRVSISAEVTRRGEGAGVLFTEGVAAPGQSVFIQLSRRMVIAQRAQVLGQIARGTQRLRVVFAEGTAEAGQGVFVQFPRCLVGTQCG